MQKVSPLYTTHRQCVNCSAHYREIGNIGQHFCRIHPGLRMSDADGLCYYSCCGTYSSPYAESTATGGCLALDHMNTALSTHSLNARLLDLQRFATTVVPSALFNHGLAEPLYNATLYRHEETQQLTRRRELLPALEHRLQAFEEVKRHHSLLRAEHCPARHGIVIDGAGDDSQEAMSVTLDLEELCQRYAVRVAPTLERVNGSGGGEGWVALDQLRPETIGAEDNWGSRRRRAQGGGASFLIVSRISDKLNIREQYSKLTQLAQMRRGRL